MLPYHSPVCSALTYIQHKSANELPSFWGVRDFWVELDAIEWLGVVCDGGVGSGFRSSDDMEVWRHNRQSITVRHPDLVKSQILFRKR
jgi:hypothetical protein